MSSADDEEEKTLQAVQKVLGPYIRPREEVAHIRRILALHLDSCLKDGSATGPLALVESSEQQKGPSAATRGLYKEYLEALSKNMKARDEYKACVQDIERAKESGFSQADTTVPSQDPIRDHLATIGLQKKKERLQVLEQHINLLEQKPAASPNFLDPKEMFRYSRPLPEVPKDVVNSIVTIDDNTRPSTHLKDLIDQLEKHVLRTKLLLKREEQLLEQVRLRRSSSSSPEAISESAKFEALNATRVELINWIESELGKASGSEEPTHDQAQQAGKYGGNPEESRRKMDQNLASIKEKYTKYSEARKALLLLVSQQPKPIMKPHISQDQQQSPTESQTTTASKNHHLLSPYLSQLLTLSHTQKSLISQKSHLNTTIAKQLRENAQHLDRLAEESQLIPAHPMPGRKPSSTSSASTRFGGTSEGLSVSSDALDTSSHVKPWVFAADSAKIATLEAVAEKIDEGQMALEASMRTIGEMEMLLGVNPQTEKKEESRLEGQTGNDDIWLDTEGEGGRGGKPSRRSIGGARRHNSNNKDEKSEDKTKGDVWGLLDGNLGLLGSED